MQVPAFPSSSAAPALPPAALAASQATFHAEAAARARQRRLRERTLLAAAAALALVALAGPWLGLSVALPKGYHDFADARALGQLPNAVDVLTNLAFALVGWLGLRQLRRLAGPGWYLKARAPAATARPATGPAALPGERQDERGGERLEEGESQGKGLGGLGHRAAGAFAAATGAGLPLKLGHRAAGAFDGFCTSSMSSMSCASGPIDAQPVQSGMPPPLAQHQYRWARVLFMGLLLTTLASGYYHLQPDDLGLALDRAGMSVAFAGLLGLAVAGRISACAGTATGLGVLVTGPALAWLAAASGNHLAWSLLQGGAIVLLLALTRLAPRPGALRWSLGAAIALYALAKALEMADAPVLAATHGILSGHSAKHIVAALAAAPVVLALHRLRPTLAPRTPARGVWPDANQGHNVTRLTRRCGRFFQPVSARLPL